MRVDPEIRGPLMTVGNGRGRECVCDYFDDDRVCDCRGFPEYFALVFVVS